MRARVPPWLLVSTIVLMVLASSYNHIQNLKDTRSAMEVAHANRYYLVAQDLYLKTRGQEDIHSIFTKTIKSTRGVNALAIGTTNGAILYRSKPNFSPKIPYSPQDQADYLVTWGPDEAILSTAIRNTEEKIQNVVWISFSTTELTKAVDGYAEKTGLSFAIILALGVLIYLILWSNQVKGLPLGSNLSTLEFSKVFTPVAVKLTLYLGLVMTLSCGLQSYLDTNLANRLILQGHRQNLETIAGGLQSDLESMLSLGIRPQYLSKADEYLAHELQTKPDIETLALIAKNGRVLYGASLEGPWTRERKSRPLYFDDSTGKILLPIREAHSRPELYLYLSSSIDQTRLEAGLLRKIGDLIGILTTVLIFMLELLYFIPVILQKGPLTLPRPPSPLGKLSNFDPGARLVRILAFLVVSSEALAAPFAQANFNGASSLSALCYFGGITLALLLTYKRHHRGSLQRIIVEGAILLGLSNALTSIAHGHQFLDPVLITSAGRLIAGLGLGMILRVFPSLFACLSLPDNGRHMIRYFMYGVGTAAMAGFTLGGMVGEALGPSAVFAFAGTQALILGLVARIALPHLVDAKIPLHRFRVEVHGTHPASICSVFFVVFIFLPDLLPQLGSIAGLTHTEMGRILGMSGLAIVLIPFVSRFSFSSRTNLLVLCTAMILASGTLLGLTSLPGPAMHILAALAAGLILIAHSMVKLRPIPDSQVTLGILVFLVIASSYLVKSLWGNAAFLLAWAAILPILALTILHHQLRTEPELPLT